MNIIILGPQGSGKGTQAGRISREMNIPHIDAGRLLREEASSGSESGAQIKKLLAKGELVPDDIVVEIVKKRLEKKDCSKGYILDGFPRTKYEAEQLEKFEKIDRAILLEVNDEIAVRRLSQRRQCAKCNAIYGADILPRTDEVCDNCGSKLVQREDDTPGPIRKRLQTYHRESRPIIEFYEARKILARFDASKPVDELFEELKRSIRE